MKHKKPAYSTPQGAVVTEVLETESAKLNCQLEFTGTDPNLPDLPQLRLDVQKQNASLAIKLANAYLRTQSKELTADDIRRGIRDCKLPGRFQAIHDNQGRWFLDIAHNCLSLPVALAWFKAEIMAYPRAKNVLIFGHESQRDTFSLISTIVEFCGKHDLQVDEIILPPYTRCGRQIMSCLL
jgi:folylpolyglutamate synthase